MDLLRLDYQTFLLEERSLFHSTCAVYLNVVRRFLTERSTSMKTPKILHQGSLMTHRDNRRERCFGYMFEFSGHGVFELTFGRLDVSSEDAKTHNQLLSQGEIAGLDQNCAVGMGGMFYAKKENGQTIVATWLGEVISRDVRVQGNIMTFQRKGMTFRGRLCNNQDCFGFKRIR